MDKSGTAGCLNLSSLICSGECHSATALYGQLLLYSEHYIAGVSKRFSIQEHIKSCFILEKLERMQTFTGQRVKGYIVEHGDTSNVANFWAKISAIFGRIVGIFLGMSKCIFICLTLCRGISNKVLHYHGVRQ